MNYRGVITDDELDALRARNACRRGEAVRAMGAAHTLHPSHAPESRAARCERLAQAHVDSFRKAHPKIIAAWSGAAGRRP